MLELKKPGLYIANGKSTSVLIRVAGTAPCLTIIRGILLNDMERDGTITVLEKESLEIQDIMANPMSYIFDKPAVSQAVLNTLGLEATEKNRIEYTEKEFAGYIASYRLNRTMYPDEYIVKTQVVLIQKGFSKSQADMIISQIETRLRLQGEM